ncbi:hypothetical protein Tmar_1149 [Thermaerobacter marianensis DSM 12885]|uniref:DUF3866 domain-containing protein n=1 Tax=Thermaerobacter marianensis (strain ATCC 700841 / DSM 12885 / JCM 10246 / 7p75a) TaxID=644966 RepID=E6SKQ4_THEM7|nr:DUF3866 family protein [Thermaerobacter marianensis]ADU51262.1 hypothetical protein Tmar_1149 [Thermaerobacter marianensis DSM 12885]
MLHARWGQVERVLSAAPHRQELLVQVDGQWRRAIAFPDLVGVARPGDRVWLNTTAVDLGLGTGGWDFVIAIPGRVPPPGRGEAMKLRYTPAQVRVPAAEEALAPLPAGLAGMPVVAAELHSQVAAVLAGWHWAGGGPAAAYVMTDGGALPAAVSRLLDRLRARGWVGRVITAGQAFGGDDEAAHLASALLIARARGAALAVVAMGPGILGTGETLGHSGLDQAWTLTLAHALGGRPILVPRLSAADRRPRHRGLSHHTAGVLGVLAVPVWLALPRPLPAAAARSLSRLAAGSGVVPVQVATAAAARWWRRQAMEVVSMGRDLVADPPFFHAGLAAGILAAALARR